MTNIDIDKVKKLDIKKGDTLVFEYGAITNEDAKRITEILKCVVMFVGDIDKVGVLKTSKFNKESK